MLEAYFAQEKERAKLGIPPLPLSPAETAEVCRFLEAPEGGRGRSHPGAPEGQGLARRRSGGQGQSGVAGEGRPGRDRSLRSFPAKDAVFLLGTMLGGYNIGPLVALLEDPELGAAAADALKKTILVYGAFDAVLEMSGTNRFARAVLESWAAGEWFLSRPAFPESLTLKVFKVDGEINTDDFSPAKHASTRPDIPLHALAMGETRFPDGIGIIRAFREEGRRVAFAGDVVGTGSSRKSACNSVMWHIGEDIPFVPNKRRGGVVLGGLIAPIFFNTTEDSGGLPIRCDLGRMKTGDIMVLDTNARVDRDRSGGGDRRSSNSSP